MSRKCGELLIVSLLFTAGLWAQAPQVTGRIIIDLPRGSISGDLCSSRVGGTAPLRFALNKGLNIESIRSTDGTILSYGGYYDAKAVGDGIEYRLEGADHNAFCVRYVGQFPVYGHPTNTFDYKGMIAFNRETLRATEQSMWYPQILDDSSEASAAVSYDIQLQCVSCRAVYLNGDTAKPGPHGRFSSVLPRPLFLFAGDFSYMQRDGITYINGHVSEQTAEEIAREVDRIRKFYEDYMGIPVRDVPALLTFESVDRSRPIGKNTLTFAVWPTLAFDGKLDFDTFRRRGRLDETFWHTIAHEIGHHYFGTLFLTSGSYKWLYAESMAEYLALKAVQHSLGQEAFEIWVNRYLQYIQKAPTPLLLKQAESAEGTAQDRYYYWPLLLLALDARIGEGRMGAVLSDILNSPRSSHRDYEFLKASTMKAGWSVAEWNDFEHTCIDTALTEVCLKRYPSTR